MFKSCCGSKRQNNNTSNETVRTQRKKIILIRHGESQFNHARNQNPSDIHADPMIFDSDLSEEGVNQVTQLKLKFEEFVKKENLIIDVIISSPLTRALKTCLGVFDGVETFKQVPIEVYQGHTEFLQNSCDLGTKKSELQKKFQNLNFDNLIEIWWYLDENFAYPDDHWESFRQTRYAEPAANREKRAHEFKKWLKARTENTIVVVGHSSFFEKTFGMWLQNCEYHILDL